MNVFIHIISLEFHNHVHGGGEKTDMIPIFNMANITYKQKRFP